MHVVACRTLLSRGHPFVALTWAIASRRASRNLCRLANFPGPPWPQTGSGGEKKEAPALCRTESRGIEIGGAHHSNEGLR